SRRTKRRKPPAEASAGAVAAVSVERRAGAKGNTHQQSTYWTQSQGRVSKALERIRRLVPLPTRGRSRMRESRTYGSGRGACDETYVPTATTPRVHHAARRSGAYSITVRTEARDQAERPLIGFLSLSNPTGFHDGFAKGLRDLGYVEGKTIYVERRFAGGDLDRLAAFAKELVELRPRMIVGSGSPAAVAVSRASQTIPIFMASVADPVAVGLIRSVSRPGGHITGNTVTSPELSGKRLQLLQEMIPSVRRVNVLVDATDPVSVELLTQTRTAAQTLGLALGVMEMQADPEF